MRKELEHIFSILKNGTQEDVRIAKQRIDKLWRSDSKGFKRHSTMAIEQLKEFDRIQNPRNQYKYACSFIPKGGDFLVLLFAT